MTHALSTSGGPRTVSAVLDGRYNMVKFSPFGYPADASIDLALVGLYGYGS